MNCNLIPTKVLPYSRFRSGRNTLKLLALLSLPAVSTPAFVSCTNDSVCISQTTQADKNIINPSDTCVFSPSEEIVSAQNQTSEIKETEDKTLYEVIAPLFKNVKDDDTRNELTRLLRNTAVVSFIFLLSGVGAKIIQKHIRPF